MSLLWFTANLVAPASGLHSVGCSRWAWSLGTSVWVVWGGLTLSRLILLPAGFMGFAIFAILIVILSSIVVLFGSQESGFINNNKQAFSQLAVNVVIIIVISVNFKSVHGIEFYYIPTNSMEPTITVGEVVMVDTRSWSIKNVRPLAIVTLQNMTVAEDEFWLKRVSSQEKKYINLISDNQNYSTNSLFLKNIPKERISGIAKSIVGSYSSEGFILNIRCLK